MVPDLIFFPPRHLFLSKSLHLCPPCFCKNSGMKTLQRVQTMISAKYWGNGHINSSKPYQKCSPQIWGSKTQNLHNYQGHRKVIQKTFLFPIMLLFFFLTQPCDRNGPQEKNWQIRSSLSQPSTFIFYVLLPFLLSPPKQQKTPTFLFQHPHVRICE